LKKKFGNASDVEKAIENKEKEIEDFEIEQKRQTSENLEKKEVVVDGKALETYNASVDLVGPSLPPGVEVAEDKVGELEVYSSEVEEKKPVHKKAHKKKEHKEEKSGEVDEEVEISEQKMEKPEEKVESVEEKIEVKNSAKENKKKYHKKEKVENDKVEVEKEPVKEEIKEVVEERISAESVSDEAQKRSQRLKSKEGKGLFQKGIPPSVEQKIEERIGKLMRGEDDDSENSSESNEEKKE